MRMLQGIGGKEDSDMNDEEEEDSTDMDIDEEEEKQKFGFRVGSKQMKLLSSSLKQGAKSRKQKRKL